MVFLIAIGVEFHVHRRSTCIILIKKTTDISSLFYERLWTLIEIQSQHEIRRLEKINSDLRAGSKFAALQKMNFDLRAGLKFNPSMKFATLKKMNFDLRAGSKFNPSTKLNFDLRTSMSLLTSHSFFCIQVP